jgi:rod shape-determining protein MreC
VGIVYEVGRAYARVLMISDINARIPVMLASSSWPGLTIGLNGEYLELAFLPAEARPEVGELVLTSGHGGILPAGLAVGRVDRVDGDDIRVRPAVEFRNLGYVSVLIGGTEGVDRSDLSQGSFFTPLPIDDDKRLLEGVNASGTRQ